MFPSLTNFAKIAVHKSSTAVPIVKVAMQCRKRRNLLAFGKHRTAEGGDHYEKDFNESTLNTVFDLADYEKE